MNDDDAEAGGTDLEARFRALTIIWIALMAGVVTFTGVIYALTRMDLVDMGGGALSPALLSRVAPLTVLIMAAGLIVGRRIGSTSPDASPEARLARYQTGRIIALALQEAAALFVGVLSLLADSGTWALIVGAAALWGMVLARPRREDLGRLFH